jgi:serine O-acetyltransferase
MINRILFSVVLPPSVKVGARTEFAYQGLAVVVHARAVIGDDVYIGPQVIIGGRGGEQQVPVIGDKASIGAGARVLGPVTIGAGATVAAGAVVLADVLPGQTVAGIPARPIQSRRA